MWPDLLAPLLLWGYSYADCVAGPVDEFKHICPTERALMLLNASVYLAAGTISFMLARYWLNLYRNKHVHRGD